MTRQPLSASSAHTDAFSRLPEWWASPLGRTVAACEARFLARFCSDLFGYHLVQVGEFDGAADYLQECPVRAKSVLGLASRDVAGVAARVENFRLPLASDSLDAVILPHTLEFSDDPLQLLREADRALIPEGRLLLCGFNPWSFWGLRRLWPGRGEAVPWCGQFVSYPRLVDWLSLLGFDVEAAQVGMFQPPFARASWLRRSAVFDRYGERFWPMLAGVYAVRAVKRVSTLRPVGPRWRRLRPLAGGAIEPTARVGGRG